jgi:hypothetical protein
VAGLTRASCVDLADNASSPLSPPPTRTKESKHAHTHARTHARTLLEDELEEQPWATLHPQPSPLNPQPSTLNQVSEALNEEPAGARELYVLGWNMEESVDWQGSLKRGRGGGKRKNSAVGDGGKRPAPQGPR